MRKKKDATIFYYFIGTKFSQNDYIFTSLLCRSYQTILERVGIFKCYKHINVHVPKHCNNNNHNDSMDVFPSKFQHTQTHK